MIKFRIRSKAVALIWNYKHTQVLAVFSLYYDTQERKGEVVSPLYKKVMFLQA
jgi:hypothetical protein